MFPNLLQANKKNRELLIALGYQRSFSICDTHHVGNRQRGEKIGPKKKKKLNELGRWKFVLRLKKKNPGIGGGIQIKKHPPIALGSQQ